MRCTFLTFNWVKLSKGPEVNSEPTHFLIFMNNGKTLHRFDGMLCSYQGPDQLQLLSGHWQTERHWISWDLKKPNLLKNNPNNTRNNMKSQIKNKKNNSISLWHYQLLPIVSYHFLVILLEGANHEHSSQNN